MATPRDGDGGTEWWPHPPGFNNPLTRQMESQEVVASPDASQRDLDVDEEAGMMVAGADARSLEEDDEAWMVPSPEEGRDGRFVSCSDGAQLETLSRPLRPLLFFWRRLRFLGLFAPCGEK